MKYKPVDSKNIESSKLVILSKYYKSLICYQVRSNERSSDEEESDIEQSKNKKPVESQKLHSLRRGKVRSARVVGESK